jgi:hypothetical protein
MLARRERQNGPGPGRTHQSKILSQEKPKEAQTGLSRMCGVLMPFHSPSNHLA